MDATIESAGKSETGQGLRHAVHAAEQLVRDAADAGDAKLEALRLKFDAQMRRMCMELDDLEDTAALQARRAVRKADRVVREHPVGAIGVAVALGLAVGALIGLSTGRRSSAGG